MMIRNQTYLLSISPVFNNPMKKLPIVMQFTRKLSRLFPWGCSVLSSNGFWALSCASSFLFWMKIGIVSPVCTKTATRGINAWRLWFVGRSFHFWSKWPKQIVYNKKGCLYYCKVFLKIFSMNLNTHMLHIRFFIPKLWTTNK